MCRPRRSRSGSEPRLDPEAHTERVGAGYPAGGLAQFGICQHIDAVVQGRVLRAVACGLLEDVDQRPGRRRPIAEGRLTARPADRISSGAGGSRYAKYPATC